jgi:hypothetical protein
VFDPGEPVLYRELWGGAVMTAIPMRVISDSPRRTALYLAPGTAFRGARTSVSYPAAGQFDAPLDAGRPGPGSGPASTAPAATRVTLFTLYEHLFTR